MSCASQFSFLLENLVSITHEVNSSTVSTSNLNCTMRTHVSERIPNMSSTYPGRRKWESFPQVCITCWNLPAGNTSFCSLLDKEETSDEANLCSRFMVQSSTGFSGKVNWGAWFKSGVHLLSNFQLCWIRIPRHCKLSRKCKQCFFQLWHWEALHRGPNICFYKIF